MDVVFVDSAGADGLGDAVGVGVEPPFSKSSPPGLMLAAGLAAPVVDDVTVGAAGVAIGDIADVDVPAIADVVAAGVFGVAGK